MRSSGGNAENVVGAVYVVFVFVFFFSSRRRHTRFDCDWSSDVCSSDLMLGAVSATTDITGEGVVQFTAGTMAGQGTLTASADLAPSVMVPIQVGEDQIGRASCRERV